MPSWLQHPLEDLKMEWQHMFMIVLSASVKISESADAMKLLATGFVSVMEECQKELNLDDKLFSDLYNYYKLDFTLLQRDTGCAIICMKKKLDLLTDDGKLHHDNAKEYALKHGADDDIASRIIAVIQSCERKHEGIQDDCGRVLEVAKCYRVGIHELHWEPKMDVIVSEVLTEIS